MVSGKWASRASLSAAYPCRLGKAWGVVVILACARRGSCGLRREGLPFPRDLHAHNPIAAAQESISVVLPGPEMSYAATTNPILEKTSDGSQSNDD